MNVISNGLFFKEIDAAENNETLAKQFVSIWEKKNSKAARAGGASLMALSLAACGGSDGPSVLDDLAAALEAAAAAAAEEVAEEAVEEVAAEEVVAELEAVVEEVLPVTKALAADADATGTAGADIFTAATAPTTAATTLVGTNDIAGGEGADIIQLAMGANFGGFRTTGADTGSMTGVETVELTNTGPIARTFTASGVSGVETYKIDGTNGIVNIVGATELSAIELSNIASGAFSVGYAAPPGGTSPVAGTEDVLNLILEGLGSDTANIVITTAGIEKIAITSNAAATAAASLNHVDLSGTEDAVVYEFSGTGDVNISKIASSTTVFNVTSFFSGNITADLTNAAARKLSLITTGTGDDSIKADIRDMQPNALIALKKISEGDDDTLTLIGVGENTRYKMFGIDTLDLTGVTNIAYFDLRDSEKISTIQLGEADAAIPNPSTGLHTFINDFGAKTVNIVGDSTYGLTTDTSGAVTVNVTADSKATVANGGDDSAATVTANSASDLTINVSGAVAQSGAITAATAALVTATISATLANTTTIAVAKAETVDITTTKGGVIAAASDFTAANIVSVTTSGGTLQNLEVLPAALSVTLRGTGTKAGWNGDALIGSATLANNLTVTASGFAAGFDQAGGGINSGLGALNLNMNAIGKGDITTGALTSTKSLNVSADTHGAFQTGTVTGNVVSIDALDVLGALTYGNIVATLGVAIDGSTLQANVVNVFASGTCTALNVDFFGGIAVDALTVDTGANSKTITITGDGGTDADTITVDVNAYTADTTSTVTINVAGIAVDTANQTAVEIGLGGETDNDIAIVAGSGTGDTVDMEGATYTGDISFTKVDTITSTGGLFTATAASFNGAELAINAGGVQHILNGTANADTINLADVTMTAGTLDILGAAGDDTITGTDAADTIDGDTGADTITGGKGIDTITLGGTDTNADVVNVSDVIVTADRDAVSEFETLVDHVKILNTMGLDSGSDIGAFVNVAGKAGATIDDIIADTAAALGVNGANVGDLSATFTNGGYAFETDTGKLIYDADGDFTGGGELIATITGTALVAGDFVIA